MELKWDFVLFLWSLILSNSAKAKQPWIVWCNSSMWSKSNAHVSIECVSLSNWILLFRNQLQYAFPNNSSFILCFILTYIDKLLKPSIFLLDKIAKTVLNVMQVWVSHVKATNARKFSFFPSFSFQNRNLNKTISIFLRCSSTQYWDFSTCGNWTF